MSKPRQKLEELQAAEKRTRIEEIRNVIGDGISNCPECNSEWTLPEKGAVNKVMLHSDRCAAYTEPRKQDVIVRPQDA